MRTTGLVVLCDAVVIFFSLSVSMWINDDFEYSLFVIVGSVAKFSTVFTAASLLIFFASNIYRTMWRYFSVRDSLITVIAVVLSNIVPPVFSLFSEEFAEMVKARDYLLSVLIQLAFILGTRFMYRVYAGIFIKRKPDTPKSTKRTMIIGAGDAGRILIGEMKRTNRRLGKPCCIIDDNKVLLGNYIDGVPVVGTRNDIVLAAKKYNIEQIIFAIPSLAASERKAVLEICSGTGCVLKAMPGIYQMVARENYSSTVRDVSVEDLLGRDPVKIDMHSVSSFLGGKTVMVTGGGGSIGSELCRQIASYGPKKLIIVDVYENNAYAIEQELLHRHSELDFDVMIASVRETDRMNKLMEHYRPDIVFHAAAHKHFPLMEDSPNEAIKNNVFGTYKTALAAVRYGVKKFVLISTDKAVNPTNIMGASKRLCEMVVQALNGKGATEFVAVRFGNVLGSNGSVIPLFKKEIAAGGPVTVTHPDIIRYFMTIPEAVSLVLEAGTDAHGGEIFVLDMGDPVKIDDLARNLIRMSGYVPDVDIKIVYTGLRPGEKLFEEMLMSEEGLRRTNNKLIYVGNPIEMDKAAFFERLGALYESCTHNAENIKQIVSEMVPTYKYDPETDRSKQFG